MSDKRFDFKLWKSKGKSKTADGRHLELKSMGAASGLTLADDEPEDVQPSPSSPLPPPPPSHQTAFARLLHEARTGSRDIPRTQKTNEKKTQLHEKAATQLERTGQKPQATDDRSNNKERKLNQRDEGISAHKAFTTAVSLCEKQHVGIVCHWSDSDPINRKGTWRLEEFDYRRDPHFFKNGVEQHKTCVLIKQSDLLNELARRVIQEFERHQHGTYITKKEQQEKKEIQKKNSPPLEKVVQALRNLYVHTMGDAGEENDKGKKVPHDNGEKDVKTVLKTAKTARREAELSRLRRLMEEQARAKAADQKRMEKKAEKQIQAQTTANGANVLDALFKTDIGPGSHEDSPSVTERGGQILETHNKATKPQIKKNQAITEADRRKSKEELKDKHRKSSPEKAVTKPHLTKAEQKALRQIKAAQKKEVDELDEEEKDGEEMLLPSAAEAEAGEVVEEDEGDDDLANAINEVIEGVRPKDSPNNKKPANNTQKNTTGPKRSAIESSTTNSPDNQVRSPLAKKQNNGTKKRARPVIENTSEESDGVNVAKASMKDVETETPKKIPRTKISMADYVAAKSAAKADAEHRRETKRTGTKTGKTPKSEALIADSDMKDDPTGSVELLTDKLNSKAVSVETTSTGKVTKTTERDGKIAKEVIETTTVAVESEQQDGSNERAEVTQTTVVASGFFEQGEITVEHATHLHTVSALVVPEQEPPRDSPPPSREREPQDVSNINKNTAGIDFTITPPTKSPASSRSEADMGSSQKKRKLEAYAQSEVESEQHEIPSPPKKPRMESHIPTSEGSGPNSSPPNSPGAMSAASSMNSSSSKKRKTSGSEKDGEMSMSPGGTKRIKRVHPEEIINKSSKQESGSGEDEKAEMECEADLGGAKNVVIEGDDDDSDYDSLFNSPRSE
ncbi:hypothetical protein EKO04_006961 [Ascochyta lentis]|uniref:Uncharacterized protein n=1 Tax=Ascochyta lentis TaxID=205686 RepID=A0A8H7J203_9PLEO|nr:hypothetical protein EKO04_006961 [Ascochyta lentis]